MGDARVQCRLAAILVADVVGYSRLLGADKGGVRARFNGYLEELVEPVAAKHRGRVVKAAGDGLLAEFENVVDAVKCAVAIQAEMGEQNADVPDAQRIDFRIGINLGDVIVEGADVCGDGVKVAARLEALAEPGGICVSGSVFNTVKDRLDLGFADLGLKKVKTVAEPVAAFRVLCGPSDAGKVVKVPQRLPRVAKVSAVVAAVLVVVGGFIAWERSGLVEVVSDSLLVLPFRAENTAGQQVADAATEDLIASFSRLSGVITAPRATSMQFKAAEDRPTAPPRETGVRFVLDGSAAATGDQIELTARLRDLHAAGDGVVWEQKVQGESGQFFGLMATLKQNAAGTMKLTLNPTERRVLEAQLTEDIVAYLAFAEAERFRRSGNFFELEGALPLYEEAIELDPGFIEAQVGYAEANFIIWSKGYNTIRYALDALGEMEKATERVLAMNPSNPYAIGIHARSGIERMNHEQALSEARAAVFLQPDEPWLRNVFGLVLLVAGNYDEARSEFAAYRSLSPRMNSSEKRDLAFQYLLLGDVEDALALLASVPAEEADRIEQYLYLANAHGRHGDTDLAKAYMDKFLKEIAWGNLAWEEDSFGIYADPAVFDAWARAMRDAGMPDSPYDFGAGREGDRLLHDDLVALFSDQYQEVHTVGPHGMPYTEERRANGTMTMEFAWLNGQPITADWEIKGDQFCYRSPAIHVGRESCNNVYIDREKSTDAIKYVSNVYSFGILNSEFRRVAQ